MKTGKWLTVWLVLGILFSGSLLAACGTKGKPVTLTLAPTLGPAVEGTREAATALPEAATSGGSGLLPDPTATPVPATATPIPTPTPTEIPLAAQVNGAPITLAAYEREIAQAGETVSEGQVLDGMIESLLLEQAADDAGITITDEQLEDVIQADIQAIGGPEAFAERLASNNLTEEEYRAKVRASLLAQQVQLQVPGEVPETMEHVHARHILVATEEEAEAILAQLRDGADFDTLARTYSLDVSTRDRGGDLGFFPAGLLLTPELEAAAFSLEPGQISDVVHSELLGYHIVQVLEREERPVDETQLEVIRSNQIRRWREELWEQATVERFVEP